MARLTVSELHIIKETVEELKEEVLENGNSEAVDKADELLDMLDNFLQSEGFIEGLED